jgi:hypothetical protein
MSILPPRDEELEQPAGPQHCQIESKCRAISEVIELSGGRSDKNAVKRNKLSGRPDNLSMRRYHRGRVIVNAAP